MVELAGHRLQGLVPVQSTARMQARSTSLVGESYSSAGVRRVTCKCDKSAVPRSSQSPSFVECRSKEHLHKSRDASSGKSGLSAGGCAVATGKEAAAGAQHAVRNPQRCLPYRDLLSKTPLFPLPDPMASRIRRSAKNGVRPSPAAAGRSAPCARSATAAVPKFSTIAVSTYHDLRSAPLGPEIPCAPPPSGRREALLRWTPRRRRALQLWARTPHAVRTQQALCGLGCLCALQGPPSENSHFSHFL